MVDFNLEENGSPTVQSDIDVLLQEIDILFDTYKDEVFGQVGFGTDYERCLYDLQLSNTALEEKVRADLNSIDLRGYSPAVRVYLLQGTEKDIALIDISLRKENKEYNKTYKIS